VLDQNGQKIKGNVYAIDIVFWNSGNLATGKTSGRIREPINLEISWYVPRFVLKTDNWMFLVALLNSLLSFFKSFRSIFVSAATGLISIAVVYASHNEILLYISAAVLVLLLTAMYMNRFMIAFRPFGVIRLYESFFGKTLPEFFTKQQKPDESIRALTVVEMNETQLTTFRT